MFMCSAVGWFLANQYLSLAVAFPIVTAVSATNNVYVNIIFIFAFVTYRDLALSALHGAFCSIEK